MTKASANRRILVVDDDPGITLTLKTGLEPSGLLQVDTFNDPELALSSFKPDVYDLALLGLRMPKMYGHELYDEMKKIDGTLKVCFMTATYQNYEALRAAFPTIERVLYSKTSRDQRPGEKNKCRVRAVIIIINYRQVIAVK